MKKWKNWLSAVLLTAVVGAGAAVGQTTVKAESKPYDRSANVAWEEMIPRVGASSSVSKNAWKKINGVCYNGSGKAIPGAITRGIDVSEWQGKINWQKVKKSDVDFAFVRISYGLGHLDEYYDHNMREAELAGVPVGTYVYSLATNTTTALKEAQFAIQQMKGKKVSYPVVFDLEDSAMGKLPKSTVSKIALTFCDEVKKAGYTPMLYMNLNWYNNHVDWSLLANSGLDVWIASYGDTINAPDNSKYAYTIWQSTDGNKDVGLNPTKGLVDGIPSGNDVDMNFGFVDYTAKIAPRWEPQAGYVPAAKPLYADTTIKNGLATENGKTYYYKNGEKYKGWKKISGKYYYFSASSGAMLKSKLVKVNGEIYYVDKKGVRVTKKLVTKSKKTYYFGSDGKAVKGMYKLNGKYYYFDPENGYMCKNYKWVTDKGTIYYFGSDGVRVKSSFIAIKENSKKRTYYFGSNGKAYKGWHTIKGKKYYFYQGKGANAGVRAQSVTLTDSKGVVSVFNKYGVCTKQYKKK